MIIYDSIDTFMKTLHERMEHDSSFPPEVSSLIKAVEDHADEMEPEIFKTKFYELCNAFSCISLNAIKCVNEETQEIMGCFQFEDMQMAKTALKEFISESSHANKGALLEAVRIMHPYAVPWYDPRRRMDDRSAVKELPMDKGVIAPLPYFCEIPETVWKRVCEIIE